MDAEDLLLRRVPRYPHAGADRGAARRGSGRSSAPTARGRRSTRVRPTCRRRSRRTSRCGSPATRPTPPHMVKAARRSCATPAGSSGPACSPGSGWRCSAQWPWDVLPAMPPEIVLLPPSVAGEHLRLRVLGPPDGGRARRSSAPTARRASSAFGDRRAAHAARRPCPRRSPWTAPGRFHLLDRVLHVYERRPFGPLRRAALAVPPSGGSCAGRRPTASWGGIQPPWVYSLMALHLLGYPLDHPVIEAGLRGLDEFAIEDGGVRRLEACQSPVWDTALAVVALADAGVAPDDPSLVQAAGWLLDEEVTVPRRLERAPAAPRAGRVGVRVRQRQLPRHRRHRGGRARAAGGSRDPDRGRVDAAIDRAVRVAARDAVPRRGLGGVRRRQHRAGGRRSSRSATSAR